MPIASTILLEHIMDRLRRQQVFGAEGLPLAGAVIELNAPVDVHTHDFLELSVLLSGRVTYVTPSGRQPLTVGAIAAVRPGEWHGYTDPETAVIANLYLGEELLHAELRWLLEVGALGRFLLRGGLAPEGLGEPGRQVVERRIAELSGPPAAPQTAAAIRTVGATYAVLAELAVVALDTGSRPGLSPAIRQVLDLIGQRPAEAWTMSRLGAAVGHSVSHLHREFRAQLGLTPMAWLAKTRAELAASLLLQSDRPVSWVGRQVGWPDPNYFSRCFRRGYGMSPTEYRRRNAV